MARAQDVTATTAGRTCVVLAPHPDDESLACGATIARKRAAGTRVVVVFAADGRASHAHSRSMSADELVRRRADEARRACAILGVPPRDVHLLGLRDGSLDSHLDELTRHIERILADVRPQEILVASRLDHNADHRALSRAVDAAPTAHEPGVVVAEYPVWFWVDGPWLRRERPRTAVSRASSFVLDPIRTLRALRPWVVASDGYLDRKQAAIRAHRTQTENVTGEEDWNVLGEELIQDFLQPVEIFFPSPSRTPRP